MSRLDRAGQPYGGKQLGVRLHESKEVNSPWTEWLNAGYFVFGQPEQENSEDQHIIKEFEEDDNERDENSESQFEYRNRRQVDQREEPEQENRENQYEIEETMKKGR